MNAPAKYRILEELGEGGMGRVYKGVLVGYADFQRPVVLKQMRDSRDLGHVRLFVDEARRYAVLDHENIGRIFDFERVGGQLCIVLEYIDGWSLVDVLDRHREQQRLPDIDLAVFIVSRVCRALQYVFEKAHIVHRDVSPSNIMMTREGAVKLIDFGIATRSGTQDRSLTGKPAYMAPEMVAELRADNRSDLFSLGTVLFEILTLERLFRGRTTAEVLEQVVAGQHRSPRTVNPAIPDPVMAILRGALQRDPEKRFASAAEMGVACEHFLYDKGYGPTNLSLKRYLSELFPAEEALTELEPEYPEFPVMDDSLLPISDSAERTRVSVPIPPPRSSPAATAVAMPPSAPQEASRAPLPAPPHTGPAPGTLAPDPRPHRPRTKSGSRR